MNDREELLKEISIKKRELVNIAMDKGIASTETIECSQELDELINSFYRNQKEVSFAGRK